MTPIKITSVQKADHVKNEQVNLSVSYKSRDRDVVDCHYALASVYCLWSTSHPDAGQPIPVAEAFLAMVEAAPGMQERIEILEKQLADKTTVMERLWDRLNEAEAALAAKVTEQVGSNLWAAHALRTTDVVNFGLRTIAEGEDAKSAAIAKATLLLIEG